MLSNGSYQTISAFYLNIRAHSNMKIATETCQYEKRTCVVSQGRQKPKAEVKRRKGVSDCCPEPVASFLFHGAQRKSWRHSQRRPSSQRQARRATRAGLRPHRPNQRRWCPPLGHRIERLGTDIGREGCQRRHVRHRGDGIGRLARPKTSVRSRNPRCVQRLLRQSPTAF